MVQSGILWEGLKGQSRCAAVRSDASRQRYHELFLQRGSVKILRPIMFQDGMDFVACELYYGNIAAQKKGGTLRRSSQSQTRRPPVRESSFKVMSPDCPAPILRKQRQGKKVESQLRESMARRCSFSGTLPEMNDKSSASTILTRSNSLHDLGAAAPRVSFHETVQVITVHPLSEIPREVRAKLWMSRSEMMSSIRDAAIADMEEQLAKRDFEVADQLKKMKEETSHQRANSNDSVIFECLESYSVGVC